MDHLTRTLVAEFPNFSDSRPFIIDFDGVFDVDSIIECRWARYPKFKDAYRIVWFLRSEADGGLGRVRAQLAARVRHAGWSTHVGSEYIWNRPPDVTT